MMDVTASGPLQQVTTRFEHEIEKVSGSRFLTTLLPASDPQEVVKAQEQLRAQHPHSRHVCFAFVGDSESATRFSDDGEPSKTAGLPMLRVLLGSSLRNTAALVTRYFGGVKLGTGGLVRAYTVAVRDAIALAPLTPFVALQSTTLSCSYAAEPKVRHWAAHYEVRLTVVQYGALEVRLYLEGAGPQLEAMMNKVEAEGFRP